MSPRGRDNMSDERLDRELGDLLAAEAEDLAGVSGVHLAQLLAERI